MKRLVAKGEAVENGETHSQPGSQQNSASYPPKGLLPAQLNVAKGMTSSKSNKDTSS